MEGYRVVDFSWVWAGPLLGMILADMGAEVIKVETNKKLDSARLTPGTKSLPIDTVIIGIVDSVHVGHRCVYDKEGRSPSNPPVAGG